MATPFATPFDADIRKAVRPNPFGPIGVIARDSDPGGIGIPLAIKYMPAKSAIFYRSAKTRKFNISGTAGYTWGTGTYVAPLAYPTSSATFGRLGVVARFDPLGWKVFDAIDPKNQSLYLSWVWRQPLYHRLSMTTMGSAFYNQVLRNMFRSYFEINCVLFPPDQINTDYTKTTDVWMCVTDWKSPTVIKDEGLSDRFNVAKACVLVDEEFYDENGGVKRIAHLNPGGRIMTKDDKVAEKIARRYFSPKSDWVRIKS